MLLKKIAILLLMLLLLASCEDFKKYNFDLIYKSYTPFEKHFLKARLTKGNIFCLNIKPENDIINKIIYKPIPFPINSNEKNIAILLKFKNKAKIFVVDTSGKIISEFYIKHNIRDVTFFINLIFVSESTYLCTQRDFRVSYGLIFDNHGNVKRKIVLPLEIRIIDAFRINNGYISALGFEQLEDTVGIPYNWVGQLYTLDSLIPIDSFGAYPVKFWYDWALRTPMGNGPFIKYVFKKDTIWGVFSLFPIMFKHIVGSGADMQWRIPIDDFKIPYLSPYILNKESLSKAIKKQGWSFQYYANLVNDSLMIVFRGYLPPYYIDFYNIKSKIPICYGFIKIKGDWQPVCSYKERIVLLNRKELIKKRKIILKLEYVKL